MRASAPLRPRQTRSEVELVQVELVQVALDLEVGQYLHDHIFFMHLRALACKTTTPVMGRLLSSFSIAPCRAETLLGLAGIGLVKQGFTGSARVYKPSPHHQPHPCENTLCRSSLNLLWQVASVKAQAVPHFSAKVNQRLAPRPPPAQVCSGTLQLRAQEALVVGQAHLVAPLRTTILLEAVVQEISHLVNQNRHLEVEAAPGCLVPLAALLARQGLAPPKIIYLARQALEQL